MNSLHVEQTDKINNGGRMDAKTKTSDQIVIVHGSSLELLMSEYIKKCDKQHIG